MKKRQANICRMWRFCLQRPRRTSQSYMLTGCMPRGSQQCWFMGTTTCSRRKIWSCGILHRLSLASRMGMQFPLRQRGSHRQESLCILASWDYEINMLHSAEIFMVHDQEYYWYISLESKWQLTWNSHYCQPCRYFWGRGTDDDKGGIVPAIQVHVLLFMWWPCCTNLQAGFLFRVKTCT